LTSSWYRLCCRFLSPCVPKCPCEHQQLPTQQRHRLPTRICEVCQRHNPRQQHCGDKDVQDIHSESHFCRLNCEVHCPHECFCEYLRQWW